jgi:hypothetical protein
MPSYGTDLDNQPLRYYNGKPVYLTLYLTLVMTVGTVITMFLEAGRFPTQILGFYPSLFTRGALWQPLTYVFVNGMSFFTPLSLIAFYFWGVEVEKYLGRRQFISVCAALVGLPVAVALLLHLFGLMGGLQGNFFLISGLLIAFATLYPDMDYLAGWIPLKWFAFASIACGSLMFFPAHDWLSLALLWTNCGVAFAMVRSTRGFDFNFKLPWPRKKPKLRVLPKPAEPRPARRPDPTPASDMEEEIDALLDKIASSGLQSLSSAEKARLETLRLKLLRKET